MKVYIDLCFFYRLAVGHFSIFTCMWHPNWGLMWFCRTRATCGYWCTCPSFLSRNFCGSNLIVSQAGREELSVHRDVCLLTLKEFVSQLRAERVYFDFIDQMCSCSCRCCGRVRWYAILCRALCCYAGSHIQQWTRHAEEHSKWFHYTVKPQVLY